MIFLRFPRRVTLEGQALQLQCLLHRLYPVRSRYPGPQPSLEEGGDEGFATVPDLLAVPRLGQYRVNQRFLGLQVPKDLDHHCLLGAVVELRILLQLPLPILPLGVPPLAGLFQLAKLVRG